MTPDEQRALRDELARLVPRYRDLALKLQGLLEQERRALEAPEADALVSVAEEKSRCVTAMQALESERLLMCDREGEPADGDGMLALIGKIEDGATLAADWRAILDIARRCRKLNTINGAISRARQEHMLFALAALSGHDAGPVVYGPAGKETAGFERRGLGLV